MTAAQREIAGLARLILAGAAFFVTGSREFAWKR